jgi:Domain of unknown function (DUF1707)
MGFMSDEKRGTAGSDDGKGNLKRVGTAERDEAIALLDEHWKAGRLDPGEHEGRVMRARAAVTQADLGALFIDLPKPGPAAESTGTVRGGGARGFLESKRDTIMALMPFLALALFFTTGYHWMWFLMVPVMGILLRPRRRKEPTSRAVWGPRSGSRLMVGPNGPLG